uniref:TIL domain-containing protein n=1 Tax=Strongyloides papillosus TaxID=174720 RepID=A0A0N5C0S8_STREA
MKLLLTLFSIPLIFLPVESVTRCGGNEVLNQCGSLCELKCGDSENKACPLVCGPPACQCAPGFRRHPTNGQCVRPNQCPANSQPNRCGRNEVLDQCGAACELDCGDSENKACPLVCGPPACKCAPGFRRHPTNGQCVRPLECPVVFDPPSSCRMNEVVVQCPPRCEPSCNNLNASCPPVCGKPGCVCAPGYVRAPKSGDCILKSQCFPSTPSPVTCQRNEVFLQCSSPCEATCEDQNPTCVRRCDEPKCQCNTGFVRDTRTGACISPSQCRRSTPKPVTCQRNEVFLQCSSPCEPTCEDQNPTCVRRCDEPKCQCSTGFVRDTRTGACISPSQCRRSTPKPVTCQRNEVFLQCSSPCEPTCEDQNPPCVKRCDEPKCQCSTGFVRNTRTGECVLPSQCRRSTRSPATCQRNETFLQCSSPCEATCEDQNPTCIEKCDEPKCQCSTGFVRDTKTGACISPSKCSRNPPGIVKCPTNEIYTICSSLCEPSCDDRRPICGRSCERPKCECVSGLLRDKSTGRCVEESRCPRRN